jgi:spore cortex formation protein SpoVR/YcgB (stage V sporulation)
VGIFFSHDDKGFISVFPDKEFCSFETMFLLSFEQDDNAKIIKIDIINSFFI